MSTRLHALVRVFLFALLPLVAGAQVTFNFNFTDTGTGFNDPTEGAARRGALQSAASTLGSYFSNYTATLTFNVSSYSTNDGTLASAGSGISGITVDGFYNTDAQKKILNGSGTGTGTISWNFFHNWDYDDSVAGGTYDFKSVAMHEILHALGFSSIISSTNQGAFGNPSGNTDVWSIFDQFLTDTSGTRLVTAGAAFNTSLSTLLANGIGSDVYFNGPNAFAANGNQLVRIYSPATFENGSSLSHLDTAIYGTNNYIMTHAVTTGQSLRTLSAIEIGMLQDIGYTLVAVPEPAMMALFFGIGALGLAAWRRRHAA